ncbi:MAG: hypothetical protein HXY50_04245, partial [Ignavibacteriaceae bacterium]|nr:hypothetical protein [Ignavibacteriaceae bacterium]
MLNKKLWQVPFLVLLFVSFSYGQESVLQLVPYNGDTLSYVNWQIIADTTSSGGLLPNRVYELVRDGIYL